MAVFSPHLGAKPSTINRLLVHYSPIPLRGISAPALPLLALLSVGLCVLSGVKRAPAVTQDATLFRVFGLSMGKIREPTSGLEPLTCSLRVCGQWLLSVAGVCKSRINKRSFVLSIARYCRCCVRVRVNLGSFGAGSP